MNAADSGEQGLRRRQERRREAYQRACVQAVLATPEGRGFIDWLLLYCQPDGNLWSANAAITGFNAARADVANAIKDVIGDVDPDAPLLILQERRLRQKQEAMELESYHAGRSGRRHADNETDSASEED